MGTATKHPVPDRVKRNLYFLTSGHSDAQGQRVKVGTQCCARCRKISGGHKGTSERGELCQSQTPWTWN